MAKRKVAPLKVKNSLNFLASTRATTLLQTSLKSEFVKTIMGFQSCGSPNFGTPNWESWDKMTFECWPYGQT